MDDKRREAPSVPQAGAPADGGADTRELLERYHETGDEQLKWQIVLQYTDLVKKVAFQARGLFNSFAQLDDIIHEGILVLLNAVDKFDASKGIKFETYIAKRLRGMMIDLVRKQDWVPRLVRQKAVRLNRAAEELAGELGCAPTGKEIADRLGVTPEEYENLRAEAAVSNLMSFEALLDSYGSSGAAADEQYALSSTDSPPEEVCQEKELHELLEQGIDSLRDNEKLVLSLYYEKELTMKEIAQVLGVSAPRVSQIHSGAIQHLREIMQQYAKE